MKEEKFLVNKYGTKILRYKGLEYVVCALKEENLIYDIMKWYKDIGVQHNKHWQSIERNLRHFRSAIEEERVNQEYLNSLIIEYRGGK